MALKRLNQYDIVRSLGAGAHGTAYEAVDTRLGRVVVLKLLRQQAATRRDLRDRLLEEARLASSLEHPNICAIYEVGEADGIPFIAMQYAPGRTLAEMLTTGALPLDVALSIGIQAASGLSAAHRIGILHRDLKPDNLMVADDGTVKILDFGLARRKTPAQGGTGSVAGMEGSEGSTYFGTTAYMAPEQFELRRSSEQSDIFSLGVILYQTVTGRHPFLSPGTDPSLVPAAIRTRKPPPPRTLRPEMPEALESIILKSLAKQPASRFRRASDLADALKGVMRSLELETGIVPGEISAALPAPPPAAPARAGRWAGLVERLRSARQPEVLPNSIGILPFHDLDSRSRARQDGFLLSTAVETRLARIPQLVVRSLSAWLSLSERTLDPVAVGREMQVEQVLRASFRRRGSGLVLHWQLLEVATSAVRAGGTITLPARDLALVQDDVAEEIVSVLAAEGHLGSSPPAAPRTELEDLPEAVREEFLDARARLARFAIRSGTATELVEVRQAYERLLELAPSFAPAHAGLGTVYLRSARYGFGGVDHLRAAERHLTRALELDPELVEAKLYRASTLIWEGDKDRARLDLQQLLRTAPPDADVLLAAGVILQLDGLLEEALRLQGEALRLNPIVAPRAYYYRARTLTFLGRPEQARHEIDRGLRLEPRHTLLRHLLGFLQFQQGDLDASIDTLEEVLRDDPNLRIVAPTLAMAYARTGRDAEALISDKTLDAAAADAETAYRVASYWAVVGDAAEAFAWLRRAVFLGNENYPWFATNPVWHPLRDHPEFREILTDLREVHRMNRLRWERLLKEL